jgi:uncharacterized protein (DUF305 family)
MLLIAAGLPAPAGRAQSAGQPLYTDTDLKFLQHMIVHHEQALTMCAWVAERNERDEFVRFARYVARAQAAEIGEMRGLLDLAAQRGLALPEVHLHADPPMAGMLSLAEMQAIAAASGAEFERLWLEGMIRHHDGALAMARAQQQAQLASGRQPYELAVLVEDILIDQKAEIVRMREWLEEWATAEPPRAGSL